MLFKSFLVITCLAPLPAVAFGDLDCITTQSCGNAGCTPETTPFAVTFHWADNTVTVTVDDIDHELPWISTDNSATAADDTLSTQLEYGDMEDINRLLRISASGTDITARYTFRSPLVTTWDATCNVRQAA